MIPIYPQEISDGLAEKVLASKRIEVFSPVSPATFKKEISKEVLTKVTASLHKQPDLFYIQDIITRTGWNKNDDVFNYTHTWHAKGTCEDKPLNIEHVDTDIVGHILGQVAINIEGTEIIPDDTPLDKIPNPFDLLNNSVIYLGCWQDEEQEKRILALVEEIKSENNPWGVSLEVLCADFAYAILEPSGTEHIIARNSKTSFLTKKLRCYGGTGEYEGCKIGRMLLNFIFSGKALTKNPANENAVINPDNNIKIFSAVDKFSCISYSDEYKFPTEKKMDELNKQIQELTASLKTANETIESLKKDKKELEVKAAEVQAKSDEVLKTKDTELSTVKASLEDVTKKYNDVKESQTKVERVSAMIEQLNMDKDQAEKAYEGILKNVTDEQFKAYLETTPKKEKVVEKPVEEVTIVASKILDEAKVEDKTVVVKATDATVDTDNKMVEFFKASYNKTGAK